MLIALYRPNRFGIVEVLPDAFREPLAVILERGTALATVLCFSAEIARRPLECCDRGLPLQCLS
jgi:hypothetical protein